MADATGSFAYNIAKGAFVGAVMGVGYAASITPNVCQDVANMSFANSIYTQGYATSISFASAKEAASFCKMLLPVLGFVGGGIIGAVGGGSYYVIKKLALKGLSLVTEPNPNLLDNREIRHLRN